MVDFVLFFQTPFAENDINNFGYFFGGVFQKFYLNTIDDKTDYLVV